MKNIAILVPSFPVASETFVVTEIKALQRAGHKVSVLTLEKSDDFRRTYQGIPVWHFSDAPACASFCNALFYGDVSSAWQSVKQQQAISNVSLMRVGCQLAHLLMLHGIEHLHCHFMHNSLAYGIVASKLAGITVSGIGHGHDIYVNRTDLAAKLAMCDFSVAVCEDMLTLFNALGAQQPKLLHCGVDVSRFLPSDKIAKPQKRLLFVGRLVEKKGLPTAFKALAKIPHEQRPQLDIVGSGPLFEPLAKLAKELGIKNNVRFLGFKTPEQITDMGRHYDAFIAPFCQAENGDRDTGPVVLKEAMAMGLPVITCDLMGCKEIVNADVGFVVPSNDVPALSKAIETFCQLSEKALSSMRQAARLRVEEKFNAHRQALQLSDWIEQV